MAEKRPRRLAVGRVILRAIRGPKPDDRRCWYWQAQVSESGARRTVWSGWARPEEAVGLVTGLLAASPGLVPGGDRPVSALLTVRDLLEVYVGRARGRLDAGGLSHRGFVNLRTDAVHLVEHLGEVQVGQLGVLEQEGYVDARLPVAASSVVHRELKTLRAAWNWGASAKLIEDRPLPRVRLAVQPTRPRYNPTQAEVWRVVEQLQGWPKFVAGMLATTGARVGEIAELRWEQVCLASGHVTFDGKTGRRDFPISEQVREVLSWAPPGSGTEFVHGRSPGTVRGSFSSAKLANACTAAGVRRFASHGFRRAAVDALQRAGVDVKTAADLLGHSVETMLKYYREVSADDRRDAADRLGDAAAAARSSIAVEGAGTLAPEGRCAAAVEPPTR